MNIIFTGDLRRPNPQKTNIEFLYHLVQYQISYLTNSSCELYATGEEPISSYGWAKLFNSKTNYFKKQIEYALVIGFELPPVLVHQLSNKNNKIINISLSPIRFMHDLYWSIETNYNIDLTNWLVNEEQIKYEASIVSAATTKLPSASCGNNSLLILGQSPEDRSVILNNKFASLRLFSKQIMDLISKHNTTLFKPHPYASSDEGFLTENEVDYYSIGSLNIYKLLSEPNIKTVVALSSSTLTEATYFGKNSIRLLPNKSMNSISSESLLSQTFWKYILNPILDTREPNKININHSRDLVRKIVRSHWGMDFLK